MFLKVATTKSIVEIILFEKKIGIVFVYTFILDILHLHHEYTII